MDPFKKYIRKTRQHVSKINFNLGKLNYEMDHGKSAVCLKKTFLLMGFTNCIAVFVCLILYQTICGTGEVILAGYRRGEVGLEETQHPWACVIRVGSDFCFPLDVYNIYTWLFRLLLWVIVYLFRSKLISHCRKKFPPPVFREA